MTSSDEEHEGSDPGRAAAAVPADPAARRREQRTALVARRLAAGAAARARWSEAIVRHLEALLPAAPQGRTLGFCWPHQGEPDVLPAVRRWLGAGGRAALPVVVAPRAPMVFREWHPGAALTPGVYDIPIPSDTPEVRPDLLLIPLTGFDDAGFRLGYGGGFFDRTLAALEPPPWCAGVGFELSRLATIHPRPHDRPMDAIVTEAGARVLRRPAPA